MILFDFVVDTIFNILHPTSCFFWFVVIGLMVLLWQSAVLTDGRWLPELANTVMDLFGNHILGLFGITPGMAY